MVRRKAKPKRMRRALTTLPHRAHRPRRAGYHVDPELGAEVRHRREADRPHVLVSRDPRGRPKPTHVRRDELEQRRRHGGERLKAPPRGPLIYLASKTLAERAAWEFVAKHKAELKWDLVVHQPAVGLWGTSVISSSRRWRK
jgi:hypothetical protein